MSYIGKITQFLKEIVSKESADKQTELQIK